MTQVRLCIIALRDSKQRILLVPALSETRLPSDRQYHCTAQLIDSWLTEAVRDRYYVIYQAAFSSNEHEHKARALDHPRLVLR